MNKLTQFNSRQLFSLGTMILLVPALRLFVTAATGYAGRAVWLTAIIAALPMLLYLNFLAEFMSYRQDGENLQELVLRCLGVKLGRVGLGLMTAWLILYSGFVLRSGADRFIVTIYPSSSPYAFTIIMGLLCLIAALGNPRSIVRVAQLVKPVVLGVLLLILAFALFSMNTANLLPITVDDALPALTGSIAAVNILSCTAYALCFIEGMSPKSNHRFRESCLWLGGMVVLMTLLCLAVTGMFGAELSSRLSRPFFVMVRNLIFFHSLERVEALVVTLWVFPDFLLVSLFLYGAQHCLRLIFKYDPAYTGERLTDLSRGRWLIWLSALAAIVCSLLIGPDAKSLSFWSSLLIPGLNLTFAFIYIPIIYIVGKLRKTL